MHRNPADVPASQFDLAGVEAGAQRQANLAGRGLERQRASNGAAGAVERRQNAVAGAFDQIAAMFVDKLLRHLIVALEQSTPLLIAHRGGAARGIDNVREQDRRQNALKIERRTLAIPGDKLLNVAHQRLDIAGPGGVVSAGIFDVFGVRDLRRERAPCCNRNQRVGLPVEHKGWNAHGRQDRGDVDHHVQRHKGFNGAGARGESFKLRDLLHRFAVRRLAGSRSH